MSVAPLVLQIDAGLEAGRELIGGKAASLVTLARLGAAVPAAFVLTTEAWRRWAAGGGDELLEALLAEGMQALEARTGRRFGAGADGLVVSVRSGAPVSMPGMMDTVLNAGLGTLAAGAEGFVVDARRRFLSQYAELVLGTGHVRFHEIAAKANGRADAATVAEYERALAAEAAAAGRAWPETPLAELVGAARAVFMSWQSSRARLYRRMRKIPDDLGTTVTIQQMVFGNRDANSGSGVAFTRDPTSGAPGLHGEFLSGGQGEEVVAGRETGGGLARWRERQPDAYAVLDAIGRQLEADSRKVHEIEYTVEQGRCYVLQCRPALLTARAAARIAVEMHDEGLLARAEALEYAQSHGFDVGADPTGLVVNKDAPIAARGLPVGGGVAVGRIALTPAQVEQHAQAGEATVFVAVETSPSLLSVMQRAAALVTMRGGATSHAAVVARELGTPCVVGVAADIADGVVIIGAGLRAGAVITVDGDAGTIHAGDVSRRAARLTAWETRLRGWAADAPALANTKGGVQ